MGLEIGARAGKLYRCFPRSGVVAMNRAQSNEPDQLVSSTVSITVLSVTPALVGEDGGLIAGHARILPAR